VAKYVLFVFPKWKILYLLFGGTNNVSVFKNIMVVEKWLCLAWCKTTDDYAIIEFLMFGVYNIFYVGGGIIQVIQTCMNEWGFWVSVNKWGSTALKWVPAIGFLDMDKKYRYLWTIYRVSNRHFLFIN